MPNACYTSLPTRCQGRTRRWLTAALALLALLTLVWLAGPRVTYGPDEPAPRPAPPAQAAALDAWLAEREAAVPGVRPAAAKGIVWYREPGRRTPWAVVYLHGFTATRMETYPLAERVAHGLQANLFHTRLTGHGVPAEALRRVTAQDWLADAVEAVRIGHAIGERVLVIGTSTGGTLGAWLALRPDAAGVPVAAQVWISPNFGPADARAEWILGPWGWALTRAITGGTVGAPHADERRNAHWTRVYPAEALVPMMTLVRRVRDGALDQVRTPVLVLASPRDRTVDVRRIEAAVARLGGSKRLEWVEDAGDDEQHVLAGELRSPGTTERLAARIVRWARDGV